MSGETIQIQAGQSGGQIFFAAARHYNLNYVFGNPGTTEVNFMDALAQSSATEFFLCLHEDVCAGAADGFARISGWPALINLHLAPGLAHGLANLHNAKRARVPVVVTVGDHHSGFGLEESPLSGNIVEMARSLCKWSYAVTSAEEVPAALHRAMLQALTPPQGPVCLVLPNNVLSQISGQAVTVSALRIPQPGIAHPAAIEEAAALLQKAQRPLIVVGDVKTAAGRHALAAIARRLNAIVWREPFPTRLDPPSDPLLAISYNKLPYFPKQRRQILQSADCLLLAGVSGFTSHFMYDDDPVISLVPDETPIIHLDGDIHELGKNAKSALPLLGDPDLTIIALQQKLNAATGETGAANVATTSASGAFKADDSMPISSTALGRALRAVVPPDTILIDESITAGASIWTELASGNDNLAHILTVRGGSLGSGIPASIGVQIAAPGKPVLAIIGDGTALYSIQALWTLARYKLPVTAIICSNNNYDIITLEILRAQGALAGSGVDKIKQYTALTPPDINFAALAEGFGVAGRKVNKASELLPALEWAFSSGAPTLVDVSLATSLSAR